ncbi:MAG: SusD/RagB family nutrient-binding outer membrane lipoprotein [Chitinophagaceae bacterium]
MKKLLIIGFTLAIVTSLASCEKGFLNVNTNPNSPTDVNSGVLVSNDLYQIASDQSIGLSQVLGMWMGHWSRSGNFIQDIATETYAISPGYSYSETFWQDMYHTNLDLQTVIQKSKANKDPFFEGISMILQAYQFEKLVDVYNDVPYTQALDINNILPKYDDAATIYTDLFAKIDSGIAMLKTAEGVEYSGTVSTDAPFDIMFQGSVSSWIQFANTLELKMLLNLSEDASDASFIPGQIAKIEADSAGFLQAGTSAMVNPGYINSTGKQSPFYSFFGFTPTGAATQNNAYFRANTYAVAFSTVTNDPRLNYFFNTTASVNTGADTVAGNYEGQPSANSNSNTSGFGPGLLGTAISSTPIIPDFESLFWQAEAALRGWIPGSAQTFYDGAITQSMVYEGVPNPTAAAQAYLSQSISGVEWPSSISDQLATIIKQEWCALNGIDELEVWNNYRRLDLPADIPLSQNANRTATTTPVRLLYPQTEIDRNGANVPAVGKNPGAQFTGNIFWMP